LNSRRRVNSTVGHLLIALNKMKARLNLLMFIVAIPFAFPNTILSQTTPSDAVTVRYCDLIQNPAAYDRKIVRTTAIYRFGFEWSELYCLNCYDGNHRTWVDFEGELCQRSKKIKPHGNIGRTVAVQVVGTFYGSGGRYGDGGYHYKFVVRCVEAAKTIANDSPSPRMLPSNVASVATCK
jgi:hypothetical protein